jgi:putative oxidoreductase
VAVELKRTGMFYNFLFPQYFRGKGVSAVILLIRLFFGVLFFMHGLDKMSNFNELSYTYPSVFGLGSYMTLMLAIICEFACSMFLIVGLLTRIFLIPMIISMAVAFFDIHDGMMPEGELALIYLIVFLGVFIVGPGRFSVDYLIDMKVKSYKTQNL